MQSGWCKLVVDGTFRNTIHISADIEFRWDKGLNLHDENKVRTYFVGVRLPVHVARVTAAMDYIALGGFPKCGDRKKNKNKNWTWCLKSQISMNFRIFWNECDWRCDETRQCVRGGIILQRATCLPAIWVFFFFWNPNFKVRREM